MYVCFFFFNDTATTEIYTLSLHDALPISSAPQIIVSTVTYDDAVHTISASNGNSFRVNTNSYAEAIRVDISNNSQVSYNSVEITSFSVKLMDSNLNPMLTADATSFFYSISLVRDEGELGIYESEIGRAHV